MAIHAYMLRRRHPVLRTEEYVSSPPALWVIDEWSDVFTLGEEYRTIQGGEYAFEVRWNGVGTGVWACRIERKAGRVRIFCGNGEWKAWNGRNFA